MRETDAIIVHQYLHSNMKITLESPGGVVIGADDPELSKEYTIRCGILQGMDGSYRVRISRQVKVPNDVDLALKCTTMNLSLIQMAKELADILNTPTPGYDA